MMRASEKLRAQRSLCKKIRVSIRTWMFNPGEAKYTNGVIMDLPYPTDEVRVLTKTAVAAVGQVFRPGFSYSKAEVLLLGLGQRGDHTDGMFAESQSVATEKVMGCWTRLMDGGAGDAADGECSHRSELGHVAGDDESELYHEAGSTMDHKKQMIADWFDR